MIEVIKYQIKNMKETDLSQPIKVATDLILTIGISAINSIPIELK